MARWRCVVCMALIVGALTVPADAAPPDLCASERLPETFENRRVDRIVFPGGANVLVLEPPDYDETRRRYPVLYLLHGGIQTSDSWILHSDLIDFTAGLPDSEQAIVVMPDGGLWGAWTDWADGSGAWETFVIETVLPYVEANYRTIADRSHRAVAGLSGGGLGAGLFATRHPDLFGMMGSFSGVIGPVTPTGIAILQTAWAASWNCGLSSTPAGPWGDPATQELHWREHNPPDLAMNLRNTFVYLSSGNGLPCDQHDVEVLASADPRAYAEPMLLHQAMVFDEALSGAGVEHHSDFYDCGIHWYANWERTLHRFWPRMMDAFGIPPRDSFDMRSADGVFSEWGWSFETDAERAPEFLDVTDASARSATLTGSGGTTVRTASIFRPRQPIRVFDGTSERVVRADARGQLRFVADLGGPHTHQQYTPTQRAAEAAGNYWQTRRITFTPLR